MVWSYTPPLRDMCFVMQEVLQVSKDWAQMPRFADLDSETGPQILEEAAKFAVETLEPTNSVGDLQGCHYEEGRVRTPDGFAAAYRRYCESGWPALACDPDFGGQGLPQILNAALYEMLNASNHGWTMYPGLAHGAYECLRAHAPDLIRSLYLPKIVSGEWLCTMCLTEPQAGSDVGLIRTRAEPVEEGKFAITGSKIFISGGEHDLTDNIVHLVLARLPGAPAGTRGISLFLVPKYEQIGNAAQINGVRCDGIEKKMGIKGSATCVMAFKGAKGWLLGEPNRGLAAMFVMMNSARLYVGLQGLGHAEMAYQNAVRYATGRVQMRAVVKPLSSGRPDPSGADPIVLQPAIRRVLLTLRAFVEGERVLGYWSAHLLDVAEFHRDPMRRAHAHHLVSLFTPVIKGFFTDNGFSLSSVALQVWGGYGYIRESGIEQTLRDSRIPMIYEGTNEIQAVDLLVRKVINDRGEKFALLLQEIREEAQCCTVTPGCERHGEDLVALLAALAKATDAIIAHAPANPEFAHRVAGDFLRVVGLILVGCCWGRMARVSAALAPNPFYRAKLETARFYFDYVLPEARFRLALLEAQDSPLPWIETP